MGSDVNVSGGMDVDLGGSLGISGLPSSYSFAVTQLPKLSLGVDPLTTTLRLEPLQVEPVTVRLALTEVPQTRTHLPADFTVGLTVLGLPLLSLRLCGEAQVVTEPYRPNPCERCGAPNRTGDGG
ncbi:MAG: hypothetical protein ACOYY2_14275 [Actinomycetota bacterium]